MDNNDKLKEENQNVQPNVENIDNNTNVTAPVDNNLSVAPPSIAPPSVGQIEELQLNEDDGVILKPFVEEPPKEEQPKEEVKEVPPIEELPKEQPQPTSPPKEQAQQDVLENKKLEQVQIDYKPPSKLKIFFMLFFFVILLAAVLFMPQITEFIQKMNSNGEEENISDNKIMNGILACDLETNDDKFDYIYSNEFIFTTRQLTGLNITSTMKGDRTLDSQALTTTYNNCMALSNELNQKDYGISVACDMFEGTIKVDQSIDYAVYDENSVAPLFKKYAFELPDFESNQNIDDIERELKSSGYTCTMSSSQSDE